MEVKLVIDGQEVCLSEDKIKELVEKFGEKNGGLWKPKEGESYWYIDEEGLIYKYKHDNNNDKNILSIGNYYKTEEEAKEKIKWLDSVQRVKEYIAENFGVFEPDWENKDETKKYTFYYEFNNMCLAFDRWYHRKITSPIGYLKSEEDCNDLIENCKEDLEIIFK